MRGGVGRLAGNNNVMIGADSPRQRTDQAAFGNVHSIQNVSEFRARFQGFPSGIPTDGWAVSSPLVPQFGYYFSTEGLLDEFYVVFYS